MATTVEAGAGAQATRAVRPALPPPAWRPLSVLVLLLGALLVATSGGYGYHRDELYFLMLRPAWGYRDQGPLVPWLARLAESAAPGSLWALRLPAVLAVLGAVVLAALLARELGGRTGAQLLAAAGLASAAGTLIFGHVLITAPVDLLVWLAVLLFVVRALLREQPRWWLAAGVVVGLGTYDKLLVALLLLGLLAGLLLVGPRPVLRNGFLWGGVLLAVLVGLPNLLYQLAHGLPELHMAHAIAAHKGHDDRVQFLPLQVVLLGPPLVAVWVAGLVALWRRPQWRPVRCLAVAYLAVCVLVLVSGGQPYYPYGLQVLLLAAGAVVVADWFGRGRRALRQVLVWAAVAVNAAVSLALALPLIPVGRLGSTPVPAINVVARDSVGWPAYVDEVVAAYDRLPASERENAAVVTSNYGEAGALVHYGAGRLPQIFSGHNELGLYGPPAEGVVNVLFVGGNPARFAAAFRSCQPLATLDNRVGVDNEEQGRPVVLCQGRTQPWATLWASVRHDD